MTLVPLRKPAPDLRLMQAGRGEVALADLLAHAGPTVLIFLRHFG